MKFVSKLFNLESAFRVLDIMDKCGVDIEQKYDDRYSINPKWYVTKEDAEDLRRIVLYGKYYKNPPKFLHNLFCRHANYGYRPR